MKIPKQVYHLVEASNWASVQRRGLLSTMELLRLVGFSADARKRISTTQRLQHTILSDDVAIRDQVPMPRRSIAKMFDRHNSCRLVCALEPEGVLLV